jgi:hypothetical protein
LGGTELISRVGVGIGESVSWVVVGLVGRRDAVLDSLGDSWRVILDVGLLVVGLLRGAGLVPMGGIVGWVVYSGFLVGVGVVWGTVVRGMVA